jgi:protein tyrosine phosphatase type 4A
LLTITGLGRAPVLVAISLIENGMDNILAINYIREKRRDAFNRRQIDFLVHYKPSKKNCHCVVM